MATIPYNRFSCAVCGATEKTLVYTFAHKFFWCKNCRHHSHKNNVQFLELQPQVVGSVLYYIYALLDPRDQSVRYIGMSRQPEIRLIEHSIHRDYALKYAWIQELKQQGLQPVLKIIETAGTDKAYAFKREKYWIRYFISQDAPLLNIYPTKRKQAS